MLNDPVFSPFRILPMKRLSHSLVFLVAACVVFAFRAEAASLTLRQDDATHTISVFRQNVEEPILTQNARPDVRPFLHPIISPDGKGVLTDLSPDHHRHQTGLYWGFKQVNGRDYFHNRGAAFWRRVSCAPVVSEGELVKWTTVYHLLDAEGNPVMVEFQTWTMRDSGDRYLLDLEWKGEGLVNLTMAKQPYGGLFLRMAWKPGMDGCVVNSDSLRNDLANQKKAFWVDVGLKIDGREDEAHIAILDHPKNAGYPHAWRVDGQMGAGPCRAIAGDWTIEQGKSETVRHQFVVYTGNLNREALNQSWEKFNQKN